MHDGSKDNDIAVNPGKISILKRFNAQQFLLIFLLIGVVVIFTLINPRFLTLINVVNMLRKMSEAMIIAVGMTFCLISGGIDLSVGRSGIMSGIIAGIIMTRVSPAYPEFTVVTIAVIAGLIAGGFIGLINGVVISKLKVTPFIATMGTMVIAFGISLLLTGGRAVTGLPSSFLSIGTGFLFRGWFKNIKGVEGIPSSAVIMIVILIIAHIILSKTEFGLNIYAIGGNYSSAKLAGLNNDKIIIYIYTITGILSAIAGMIITARVISAQPGLWGYINLEVIAGCIIGGTSLEGGRGSVIASFFGILLMTMLSTGLNIVRVEYSWQQVLIGVIIIIAVAMDMISRRDKV